MLDDVLEVFVDFEDEKSEGGHFRFFCVLCCCRVKDEREKENT